MNNFRQRLQQTARRRGEYLIGVTFIEKIAKISNFCTTLIRLTVKQTSTQ
jgi:hypothetical protein